MNQTVESKQWQWLMGVMLLVISGGALPSGRPVAAEAPPFTRTLVWISVDGIRPDYLQRAETPLFDRLRETGVYSATLTPPFPTLTFTAHTTKATGAPAERHGITGNVFYDRDRDRTYGYPNLPWLLEAEPIWTTAARQGIVTAVYGWPLSHRQAGRYATRYFDPRFDRNLTDKQRLEKLLTTWREHDDPLPLRFMMGYMIGPDSAGHRYGSDAPETAAAMQVADAMLATFERDLLSLWESRRQPDDELFLLITSDHGMSAVHTLVNPRLCAGLPARGSPVRRISNGNITHFFFNGIDDDEQRAEMQAHVITHLQAHDIITVYRRDDLPAAWRYAHPHRTGDLVAVVPRGYTFSNRIRRETMPAAEHGEPLGMHGYCPVDNPDMLTVARLQRYPDPLGGHNLGAFGMDQLHATVARLLGIRPADTASPDAIAIPGVDSRAGRIPQ